MLQSTKTGANPRKNVGKGRWAREFYAGKLQDARKVEYHRSTTVRGGLRIDEAGILLASWRLKIMKEPLVSSLSLHYLL
jgi:hypothetical protein